MRSIVVGHGNKKQPADKNITAAVCFPAGRRLFPQLAEYIAPNALLNDMIGNARAVIALAGGRHKRELVQLLCEGLPKGFSKSTLNVSESMWRRSKEGVEEGETDRYGRHADELGIGDVNYKAGVNRCKNTEAEEYMLYTYFYNSTIQVSGADTATRIQDKSYYEWEADMHANYPLMIRKLTGLWPNLKPMREDAHPTTGWTNWQANILSALKAGEDAVDDKEERE